MMLIETLQTIFNRDLVKLRAEIAAYRSEEKIWVVDKQVTNTAGNLCLHLIGNLNCYIGAELGNSGYIRQRDLEFSLKNIPREILLKKIDETITVVDKTLADLPEEQLYGEYPALVFKEKTSTLFFLVHLAAHLSYHLGQINYHRRLLDN